MKKTVLLLTLLLTGLSVSNLNAQEASARKRNFNLDGEIALSGYDPVAYFKNNAAIIGVKDLAVFHQGVLYYFSSLENKEAFKKNPSQYEPAYGGWCAYAMGTKGSKVDVDPATFKILNGKLYLFYNRHGNNTLKSWNKDESSLRQKADENWKNLFN